MVFADLQPLLSLFSHAYIGPWLILHVASSTLGGPLHAFLLSTVNYFIFLSPCLSLIVKPFNLQATTLLVCIPCITPSRIGYYLFMVANNLVLQKLPRGMPHYSLSRHVKVLARLKTLYLYNINHSTFHTF